MHKIKKIFFTLFLFIVSISIVNAKDTVLMYDKTTNENGNYSLENIVISTPKAVIQDNEIDDDNPYLVKPVPIGPTDPEPPKDTYEASKIENFCNENSVLKTLRFLGYILLVVKIAVPILLIIFGTIDFSKAIMSSDNDAVQKSTKSLVTRIIAGIIIFFIPTIVNFAFSLAKYDEISFGRCRECIFSPSSCNIK